MVIHSFSSCSGMATLTKRKVTARYQTRLRLRSAVASLHRRRAASAASSAATASATGSAPIAASPKRASNRGLSDRNQNGPLRAEP